MFKIKDAWQIVENTEGIQTFTDVDGQQYRYKRFGTQIWMLDNYNRGGLEGEFTTDHNTLKYNSDPVKTVRYKDVLDYQNWNSEYGLNRGAIYMYGNSTYGFVTDLIPSGWHIATQSDWETLISWANTEYPGFGLQALMAKTTFWCPQNPSSSVIYDNYDKSGFGIVPAGRLERSNNAWQYSDSAANSKAYFIIGDKSVILIEQAQNSAPAYSFPGNYSNWTWGSVRLVKDGGLPPAQPIITDIVTSLDSTGSDNKLATEKATRSAIASAVSSKMSNPMTTAGDLIVGGTSGAPSRLATGTQGQVLKVGASGLAWANESTVPVQSVSDTNSIDLSLDGNGDLTADLKIDTSTPGNVQLSVSSDGLKGSFDETVKALSSDNPVVVDYNSSDEYTVSLAVSNKPGNKVEIVDDQGQDSPGIYVPTPELDGVITTAGDLIVGNASGVPEALSAGAEGKVLKITSGVPAWSDDIGFANPMNAAGQMISGSMNGTPTAISAPSAGQVMIGFTASGMPYVIPQWHNANESIIWGMPWTTKGSLVYAGDPYASAESQFLSGKNKLESLPIGTQGQVLAVNSSAVPAWTDPEVPSIQNFSLPLIDSFAELASDTENKIHFVKTYCQVNKKITRMGFFHRRGTQGVVGLGVYNPEGSALVVTPLTGVTSSTIGHVCWVDLTGPVTLTRGNEYWFALFTGWAPDEWNAGIVYGVNTSIAGVGNTITISYSTGRITAMPASIPGTSEGQFIPWIVAD